MTNFKYYDGQVVMLGDFIVGKWCGDCEIIKCEGEDIVAKNIHTDKIYELWDYTYNCDLINRKEDLEEPLEKWPEFVSAEDQEKSWREIEEIFSEESLWRADK